MAPNTLVDQQSAQHVSSLSQPASRSHVSGEQDLKNKPSGECKIEKSEGSNDVTTDLELKTPGSTADQVNCSHLSDWLRFMRETRNWKCFSQSSLLIIVLTN
jgi:hypothetical protein